MNRSPDRIDIHNRKHRLALALRNLEQYPHTSQENKMLIQRFVTFCQAANISVERQLFYLHKQLEASKAEIERLRVDLALVHSGRRTLGEDIAAQARMMAERREEAREQAWNLKSLRKA